MHVYVYTSSTVKLIVVYFSGIKDWRKHLNLPKGLGQRIYSWYMYESVRSVFNTTPKNSVNMLHLHLECLHFLQ